MYRIPTTARASLVADIMIAALVIGAIYAISLFAAQWDARLDPEYPIELSLSALPRYMLFSTLRGFAAYFLSVAFTFLVGYTAAKSALAEKIFLPALDILQSIPVLGFLPGLVLGLVAIFPHTNIGLELAAILMIFTGQVWNMTFAFYSSIKSVPGDLQEAVSVMRLSPLTRFLRLELPFSSVNLVWNSMMSMAGGWFFLTVCEAFTLGNRNYRLPGVGAYMAVAIERGDRHAALMGALGMAGIIVFIDIFLWRPMLAIVHQYRLESEISPALGEDRLLQFIMSQSSVIRWLRQFHISRRRKKLLGGIKTPIEWRLNLPQIRLQQRLKILRPPLLALAAVVAVAGSLQLLSNLAEIQSEQWAEIAAASACTLARVLGAVILATVWTLPAGIWLSRSPERLKVAQPIAQLMASFPAPMLYPLVLGAASYFGLPFALTSMLLMLLGVQWYILFNTLAGGLRISREIEDTMDLIGSSTYDRWRYLYVPSVFPALVTGWITAAGGAWNASIVAEYISDRGKILETRGIGALISQSAARGDFSQLSACLVVMVVIVVLINRFFWNRLYRVTQTRFRLDF